MDKKNRLLKNMEFQKYIMKERIIGIGIWYYM